MLPQRQQFKNKLLFPYQFQCPMKLTMVSTKLLISLLLNKNASQAQQW